MSSYAAPNAYRAVSSALAVGFTRATMVARLITGARIDASSAKMIPSLAVHRMCNLAFIGNRL
jgi:hypothetical protein